MTTAHTEARPTTGAGRGAAVGTMAAAAHRGRSVGSLAAAALALTVLPGCGGHGADTTAGAGPCTPAYSATALTPLPAGLPVPAGAHTYDYRRQGGTETWLATVPGDKGQIVAVRDAISKQLRGAGFKVLSSDQEPGRDADLTFSGTVLGSLKVGALCGGHLGLRYATGPGSL